MSWKSFLLAAVVIITAVAHSKAYDENIIFIGAKAGGTFSSFWGDGIEEFEDNLMLSADELDGSMLLFYTGGIFMTWEVIPDFFALQPEILYHRAGKKWEVGAAGTTVDIEAYTDYLVVPVVAKLLIPFDIPLTPGAYLGPVAAIKLRSATDGLDELGGGLDIGFMAGLGDDTGDATRPVDFGLATGLSFDIGTGPGVIVIDARYTFGFIDVFDVDGGDKIKNSVFSIMAGYALAF
jgi:hypothetical protein